MLTIWPLCSTKHLGDRPLRDVKEASEIYLQERRKLALGVLRKGLRQERTRIVNQGVHASEALFRCLDDQRGCFRL